jgi:hypothetical protein
MADLRGLFDERVVIVIVMKMGVRMRVSCFYRHAFGSD